MKKHVLYLLTIVTLALGLHTTAAAQSEFSVGISVGSSSSATASTSSSIFLSAAAGYDIGVNAKTEFVDLVPGSFSIKFGGFSHANVAFVNGAQLGNSLSNSSVGGSTIVAIGVAPTISLNFSFFGIPFKNYIGVGLIFVSGPEVRFAPEFVIGGEFKITSAIGLYYEGIVGLGGGVTSFNNFGLSFHF